MFDILGVKINSRPLPSINYRIYSNWNFFPAIQSF